MELWLFSIPWCIDEPVWDFVTVSLVSLDWFFWWLFWMALPTLSGQRVSNMCVMCNACDTHVEVLTTWYSKSFLLLRDKIVQSLWAKTMQMEDVTIPMGAKSAIPELQNSMLRISSDRNLRGQWRLQTKLGSRVLFQLLTQLPWTCKTDAPWLLQLYAREHYPHPEAAQASLSCGPQAKLTVDLRAKAAGVCI